MVAHPRQNLSSLASAAVIVLPMRHPHGSPFDRGDADAHYGRQWRPHKWLDSLGRLEVTDLTIEETAEYDAGYDQNPSGAKDWC